MLNLTDAAIAKQRQDQYTITGIANSYLYAIRMLRQRKFSKLTQDIKCGVINEMYSTLLNDARGIEKTIKVCMFQQQQHENNQCKCPKLLENFNKCCGILLTIAKEIPFPLADAQMNVTDHLFAMNHEDTLPNWSEIIRMLML
jgi:hypothetical protein